MWTYRVLFANDFDDATAEHREFQVSVDVDVPPDECRTRWEEIVDSATAKCSGIDWDEDCIWTANVITLPDGRKVNEHAGEPRYGGYQ